MYGIFTYISMFGIFTYIYHNDQPNVGKNIPYNDPMGSGSLILLLHTGSIWLLQHRFVLSSAWRAIVGVDNEIAGRQTFVFMFLLYFTYVLNINCHCVSWELQIFQVWMILGPVSMKVFQVDFTLEKLGLTLLEFSMVHLWGSKLRTRQSWFKPSRPFSPRWVWNHTMRIHTNMPVKKPKHVQVATSGKMLGTIDASMWG